MQEINDHVLRITGGASLPQELDPEKSYKILTEISVKSVTHKKNEDGTSDLIYTAGITSHIDLEEGEKIIRAKDPRKNSQRIRGAIWHLQQDEGMTHIDEEVFYNQMSAIIIEHLPELFTKYFK